MAILNYTTSIQAAKTIMEIQINLSKHGATAVLTEYEAGNIEAISFKVPTQHGTLAFRLPVDPDAVRKVMFKQNVPRSYRTRAQAERVAWRIVKDWVAAQMALLETEMVKMEQIFLPYMVTSDGKTLYDSMVSRNLLTEGKGV